MSATLDARAVTAEVKRVPHRGEWDGWLLFAVALLIGVGLLFVVSASSMKGAALHGNAYIYGGAVHTYGSYAADLIDLVNGDLDTSQVITGDYILEALANRSPDAGDPEEWGAAVAALRSQLPSLHTIGGCCGTNHAHVEAAARAGAADVGVLR